MEMDRQQVRQLIVRDVFDEFVVKEPKEGEDEVNLEYFLFREIFLELASLLLTIVRLLLDVEDEELENFSVLIEVDRPIKLMDVQKKSQLNSIKIEDIQDEFPKQNFVSIYLF